MLFTHPSHLRPTSLRTTGGWQDFALVCPQTPEQLEGLTPGLPAKNVAGCGV